MNDELKVLVVEPLRKPYVKAIPNKLEDLQGEVGGWIECIYPFSDKVGIICNEESKLMKMMPNRVLRTEDGQIYDFIAGTFLVVGLGEEDFVSLPDDMIEKYTKVYQNPELIGLHEGKLVVMPFSINADPEFGLQAIREDGTEIPIVVVSEVEDVIEAIDEYGLDDVIDAAESAGANDKEKENKKENEMEIE